VGTSAPRSSVYAATVQIGVASRGTWLSAGVLALAAAAWIALLTRDSAMEGESMAMGPELERAGIWLLAWATMMAAMMLPSTTPLVALYGKRSRRAAETALLVAGYLATWTAVGAAAYGLDRIAPDPGRLAVAAVLIIAGLYQFTPAKDACLRHCRSPVDFLVTHWHGGSTGALRIGVEHGAYCVGCCWALMAVLVVAGAMGLFWVVGIALAVAAEKLLPAGPALGRIGGIALVAAGVVVAV
jgi:predicted metal-binding membrane protein